MDRRKFIGLGSLAGAAAAITPLSATSMPNEAPPTRYQNGISPWPICLDTSTIRPATLTEKVAIAAKAGYDAIEPWDMELEEYQKNGGSLKELGKKIKDLGLKVPSVIGLWNALPPTKKEFESSLTDTRRRMQMAADIGAEHIQTIPNTVGNNYDPKWVSARYRDIIQIGLKDYNIKPALVFVKYFPVKTLGQAAAIAIDSRHPNAMVIPDVYHMYISEGGFEGLKLLNGEAFAIFQFNDAPSQPAFDQLNDEHRVYPGDGILPLKSILRDLKNSNFKGCISLELYNPEYYKQNPKVVAETGLRKTLEVIKAANV